jgi:single-strand DNA-binding protein
MADVNHVILIGRCTRDAELKYTSGGMAVCKFAIAVNRRKKSGDQWVDEASFFDVVAWGKTGEALNQYLVKGKQVAVEGELHQNRWEQDGQSRSKVEINASNIQLLGGGTEQTAPAPSRPRGQPASVPEEDYGPRDFPDDIPF